MNSITPFLVRKANDTDLETLVAYSADLARETEGKLLHTDTLREGVRALLTCSSLGFFLVAEVDNHHQRRTVGQLMVTYEWSDWRNSVFWWIQSVYVEPPWRRQGVYREMHQHIVAKAKSSPDVCGVRLYVEQGNHTAQVAYQRLGLCRAKYIVYEEDFVYQDGISPTQISNSKEA